MTLAVDPRHERAFQGLLAERGMDDPHVFADVEYFNEEPVWLYYDQLAFLSDLSVRDANRVLITATVLYLERVISAVSHGADERGRTILRMVSVTGWLGGGPEDKPNYDGSADYLCPNIWCADLSDPRLDEFRVWPPASAASAFVAETLGGDERFTVAEGAPDKFGAPVPARVYIYLPGSEGTDRLKVYRAG